MLCSLRQLYTLTHTHVSSSYICVWVTLWYLFACSCQSTNHWYLLLVHCCHVCITHLIQFLQVMTFFCLPQFTVLNTHTRTFNGPFSRSTRVSQYQKGKTSLDFTEVRDNEWQWHQLDHMQVCTSIQTDNHASTPPLSFLQAGCPSCRPTN